jgi:hypothetical protein
MRICLRQESADPGVARPMITANKAQVAAISVAKRFT